MSRIHRVHLPAKVWDITVLITFILYTKKKYFKKTKQFPLKMAERILVWHAQYVLQQPFGTCLAFDQLSELCDKQSDNSQDRKLEQFAILTSAV